MSIRVWFLLLAFSSDSDSFSTRQVTEFRIRFMSSKSFFHLFSLPVIHLLFHFLRLQDGMNNKVQVQAMELFNP